VLLVRRCSIGRRKYREVACGVVDEVLFGRPTFLTDDQMLKLRVMLIGKDSASVQSGFALLDARTRRGSDLREVRSAPVEGHLGECWQVGMSAQRPPTRPINKTGEGQGVAGVTYPRIKAEAETRWAQIFFADEAGVRNRSHAGTTWHPSARRPS